MARPPLTVQWTPEQNEKLKTVAAQGGSAVKAAAALGLTTLSVLTRARKLGIAFPTVREVRKKLAMPKKNKSDMSPRWWTARCASEPTTQR